MEQVRGKKCEVYLHLVGESKELDAVEKQIAKYKIARFMDDRSLLVLIDQFMAVHASYHQFEEYCREKGIALLGRKIIK
ncbi:MAG: hypothetical protein ACXQS8_05225 [Candidatus Helarchaeales archaeon]